MTRGTIILCSNRRIIVTAAPVFQPSAGNGRRSVFTEAKAVPAQLGTHTPFASGSPKQFFKPFEQFEQIVSFQRPLREEYIGLKRHVYSPRKCKRNWLASRVQGRVGRDGHSTKVKWEARQTITPLVLC